MATSMVVLDNGAATVKVGFSTQSEPRVMPNCVTKAKNVKSRVFIGDQIDECKDLSGLYFLLPFQKGYLTNWEIEKQVWDYTFGKDNLKVDFNSTGIVFTEPYFNFQGIQEAINEIFFEEYEFQTLLRANASYLSQFKRQREQPEKQLCCLVVDSGYSFTHIIPYFKGKKIKEATKRVSIGGKMLTNHLKEVISYRQLMVMDETYVINQLKEDVCYVSTQFMKDMDLSRSKNSQVYRDYVLPDYTHIKRGYVKTPEESSSKPNGSEQLIHMGNERFCVPELLFHPSDVGIHEMGISEAIVHTINLTPEEMRPHFYKNILLTGGNCMLPGFRDRVYSDVRSMTPEVFDVQVFLPNNPSTYAWEGGVMMTKNPEFNKMVVTKKQYEEHGHNICQDKFDI